MPADNPVRKRERESETIESPEENGSNGLPTPNISGPSNGSLPAPSTNGNSTQDPDKPVKPHKPLNRVPRMWIYITLNLGVYRAHARCHVCVIQVLV
jgi:hypothetical protein